MRKHSIMALMGLVFNLSSVSGQVHEEWVARYNGPGNSTNRPTAIALDAQVNVYVTGTSVGIGNIYGYATLKYSPEGRLVWTARYEEPGGNGQATAMALDREGNIYVTGSSGIYPNLDYVTIKYDTDGQEIWVARYDGPGHGYDEARAIVLDGSGSVYVTGNSLGSGTGMDYATIKYDADGKELWVARYNGLGNRDDYAWACALDGAGHLYVTGSSFGGFTTYDDYATIKYDADGREIWVALYTATGDRRNIASALALDAQGNIYVTGGSWGGPATQEDYATIKYSPDGEPIWLARYNGPANGADAAYALTVDAAGHVYVTGVIDRGGRLWEYATIKYSQK